MITARLSISAATYSQMIDEVGREVDALWENGNWRLVSATASRIETNGGTTIGWLWDVEVEWMGLRP